jgi:arylsulfatase A-like enzyme
MRMRAVIGGMTVGLLAGAAMGLLHEHSAGYLAEGLPRLAASEFISRLNKATVIGAICAAALLLAYYVLLVAASLVVRDPHRRKAFAFSGTALFVLYLPTAALVNRELLPSLLSPPSLVGNFILCVVFLGSAVLGARALAPGRLSAAGSALSRTVRRFNLSVALVVLAAVFLFNAAVHLYVEAGACHGANVLFISVDTLRRDRLSCYGSPNATPNIDLLARRGVKFPNAYVQMSTTLPSHAAYLTGRYPTRLGLFQNGQIMSSSVTTIAEVLRDRNYDTAAFVSSYVVMARFGLDQGFKVYDDKFSGGKGGHGATRTADAVTSAALKWLRKGRTRPFFVWIHYYDPHSPYGPPDRFMDVSPERVEADTLALARARYEGEVRFVDEQIGRLMEEMESFGALSRTMIVFFADHGEGLGDHNYMWHGAHIYEEQVHVPMLMVFPGVLSGGEDFDGLVQSVDVVPTVFDALGVEFDAAGSDGRSLLPALTDKDVPHPTEYAFGQRRRYLDADFEIGVDGTQIPLPETVLYVKHGSYKYIWSEMGQELYDLTVDPRESVNLVTREPGIASEMSRNLQTWFSDAAPEEGASSQGLNEEVRERLRALGYLD